MLVSVVAMSLMYAVINYLESFSVYQIIFFRSTVTFCFITILLFRLRIPILGNNKILLFLRGFFGIISMTCFFFSLKYLNLGLSVSVRYLSPIFAIVFACFFLNEKVGLIQWILFLFAIIGVFVIKDLGINISSQGLILAITSAISLGIVYIIINKIGKTDNSLVIVNYFMFMGLIFGGLLTINNWKNPNFIELILLLLSGVFGFIGVLCMTKAFQLNETNIIAPLKYLEVVLTIIIGIVWFDENYTIWTCIGILMISFSAIYNLFLIKNKV